MRPLKDLTHQRFGRLVALNPTEQRRNGKVGWMCRCDCGKRKIVRSSHLSDGSVQSCGCAPRKRAAAA